VVPGFDVRPDGAIGVGCKLMSAEMELIVDECVGAEEALGLSGRFEPLHLPLCPIIQISALSVLDARKQLTLQRLMPP
jgi:hypothetical protein